MFRILNIPVNLKILVLLIYEIGVGLLLHLFINDTTAILYVFLSWNIPSIILLYKLPNYRVKYILSAFLWCIPASLLIDLVGHYTKVWDFWENPLFASTGIRVLSVPIESFYWGFSFWLLSVLIYEYFFDKHRGLQFRKTEKLLLLVLSLLGVIAMYLIQNRLIGRYEQFFITMISVYSIFNVIFLYLMPKLRFRFFLATIVLFFIGIITEVFSLSFNLWDFTGDAYLYTITILGKMVPIEEILWWFVVPMSIVIIHEVFIDTKD